MSFFKQNSFVYKHQDHADVSVLKSIGWAEKKIGLREGQDTLDSKPIIWKLSVARPMPSGSPRDWAEVASAQPQPLARRLCPASGVALLSMFPTQ